MSTPSTPWRWTRRPATFPTAFSNVRADFIIGDDEPKYPEVLNDRERELW
jgi:hypothetical protein